MYPSNNSPSSIQQNSEQKNIITQKGYLLHTSLRARQIQRYKQDIRRNISRQNLQQVMKNLPEQLPDVLKWCQYILNQFSTAYDYRFPQMEILQLLKLIQKYPCHHTLSIFLAATQNMSINGVHILFQHDVVGFLYKIINTPQLILIRNSLPYPVSYDQTSKNCLKILSNLCEVCEKARNFIIIDHKLFNQLEKTRKKYGDILNKQIVYLVCSSTHKPVKFYSSQFVKIISFITNQLASFHNHLTQQNQNLVIKLVSSLTNIIKWRQKWAMQHITSQATLTSIKNLYTACLKNDQTGYSHNPSKQFEGQLANKLNMLMIYYIQVQTTNGLNNQFCNEDEFLTFWFRILDQYQNDSFFNNARRDIYFIMTNIFCEGDDMRDQSEQHKSNQYHHHHKMHLIDRIIFQYNCFNYLANALHRETSENVFQQLSFCMQSLLRIKDVNFSEEIIKYNVIREILDVVVSNRYEISQDCKEDLLIGIVELLKNCNMQQMRQRYIEQIMSYEDKLNQFCNGVCDIFTNEGKEDRKGVSEILEQLLYMCMDYDGNHFTTHPNTYNH